MAPVSLNVESFFENDGKFFENVESFFENVEKFFKNIESFLENVESLSLTVKILFWPAFSHMGLFKTSRVRFWPTMQGRIVIPTLITMFLSMFH